MNIIISTKHTKKTDKYITMWRDNNSGYTLSVESAGLYLNPTPGYHDSENAFPVSLRAIKEINLLVKHEGVNIWVVPNTKTVWLYLNQPEIAKQIKSIENRL